ncbi:MAG: phosphoribosylglycinamide formyltransferase [Candidatus Omnitrophica bacterium]|nr:phosphoribosylglycinamide formyltransferase [Candidatus Omnitrophota bacterium]
MNFAVLVSGNGSNLQAIIEAAKKGKIKGDLKLVLSDRADAFALTRAEKAGVRSVVVDLKDHASREAFDEAVVKVLKKENIQLVVLAGFMRILSPAFIKAFKNSIINIHPSLLPAFKGGHAIKDALEYGALITGVTVHFVDEEIDHGAIIAQAPIEIDPRDTMDSLSKRIHEAEHALYPKVIDLFLKGRLKISGRKVRIS